MSKPWTWAQDRNRATSRTRETWRNTLFKPDPNHVGLILDVMTADRIEKFGELHLSGRLDGEITLALQDVNPAFE